MTCKTLSVCLICLAVSAWATPYEITDPYLAVNCGAYPTPGCDVIGDRNLFDIRSIRFIQLDSVLVRAEIDLNYNGGDVTLSDFVVGDLLSVGDVLFRVSGQYKYGTPLKVHGAPPDTGSPYHGLPAMALEPGILYRIVDADHGVLTAYEALGTGSMNPPSNTRWPYAYDQAVWMFEEQGRGWVTPSGFDPINAGDPWRVDPHKPEIIVPFAFIPTGEFLDDLFSGQMGVHFASATCANDYIDGLLAIPDPATWILTGAGLIGLGFLRRRR